VVRFLVHAPAWGLKKDAAPYPARTKGKRVPITLSRCGPTPPSGSSRKNLGAAFFSPRGKGEKIWHMKEKRGEAGLAELRRELEGGGAAPESRDHFEEKTTEAMSRLVPDLAERKRKKREKERQVTVSSRRRQARGGKVLLPRRGGGSLRANSEPREDWGKAQAPMSVSRKT